VREIRTLRSTWRGLETRHGRDIVTLADERARQRASSGVFRDLRSAISASDPTYNPAAPPLFPAISLDSPCFLLQGEVLPTLCSAMTFSHEMGPAPPSICQKSPCYGRRARDLLADPSTVP